MGRNSTYIFLGIFCAALIGLQINSTARFRMKLADYYRSKGHYAKTIELYNKILTKNNVKRSVGRKTFSKICLDSGYLYAKLDLTNLAIESYAGVIAELPVEIGHYYLKNDLAKDKLLAIGLLEAGRWNAAIEEFRRLRRLYPQFQNMEKYINTAIALKKEDPALEVKSPLFLIGDAYIQNQLFDEAKAFFSKRILDYGMEPVEVLRYLQKKYAGNREVKQKVWGDDIYVILENFEALKPQLSRWLMSSADTTAVNHYITKEDAFEGAHSEFLDVAYTGEGNDRWVKITKIPLGGTGLNLGIRLYTKSSRPSSHNLMFNVIFPKQGGSGIFAASLRQDIGNGWEELRMENLLETAKGIASRFKWDAEGVMIDRIILDTGGINDKFYIDNLELYIT